MNSPRLPERMDATRQDQPKASKVFKMLSHSVSETTLVGRSDREVAVFPLGS